MMVCVPEVAPASPTTWMVVPFSVAVETKWTPWPWVALIVAAYSAPGAGLALVLAAAGASAASVASPNAATGNTTAAAVAWRRIDLRGMTFILLGPGGGRGRCVPLRRGFRVLDRGVYARAAQPGGPDILARAGGEIPAVPGGAVRPFSCERRRPRPGSAAGEHTFVIVGPVAPPRSSHPRHRVTSR